MAKSNFERMIELADTAFSVRTDPNQLSVEQNVIERLQQIHPSTMSDFDDGNGPVVWILVIPTTSSLMHRFINKEISEKELFELTPLDIQYDTIYLCSAMVLEEYRGKGLAKNLTMEAIENIRKEYPIKTLFVWVFSREGEALAEKIAVLTDLPLNKR
ncbi:MAG: GNAT family N-acetyltransferase [Bacteroidetes bacterium]|nr:GNAT family N-acetyltransferase [Bacteroidota bacterium]